MRKDSPLVACIAAAVILLLGGALASPRAVWSAGPAVLRLAPTMVDQARVTASALRTGAFSAPGLIQDRELEPSRPERPVRYCQGDGVRSCPQSECARVRMLRQIPVLVPTSG